MDYACLYFTLLFKVTRTPYNTRFPHPPVQMYVECSNAAQKYEAIRNIYTIPVGQSMFFCRTRANARDLTDRMTKDGHHVALLSGRTPEMLYTVHVR